MMATSGFLPLESRARGVRDSLPMKERRGRVWRVRRRRRRVERWAHAARGMSERERARLACTALPLFSR